MFSLLVECFPHIILSVLNIIDIRMQLGSQKVEVCKCEIHVSVSISWRNIPQTQSMPNRTALDTSSMWLSDICTNQCLNTTVPPKNQHFQLLSSDDVIT